MSFLSAKRSPSFVFPHLQIPPFRCVCYVWQSPRQHSGPSHPLLYPKHSGRFSSQLPSSPETHSILFMTFPAPASLTQRQPWQFGINFSSSTHKVQFSNFFTVPFLTPQTFTFTRTRSEHCHKTVFSAGSPIARSITNNTQNLEKTCMLFDSGGRNGA